MRSQSGIQVEVKADWIRMFDYDLWANLKWFPHCADEPFRSVMAHVIRSQIIWLERCGGPHRFDADDPYDLVEAVCLAWQAHLDESDLDETVHYVNNIGIKQFATRLDIVRQVINHGTYHRGQIRAMVEMSGQTNFPDTDYLIFLADPRN